MYDPNTMYNFWERDRAKRLWPNESSWEVVLHRLAKHPIMTGRCEMGNCNDNVPECINWCECECHRGGK